MKTVRNEEQLCKVPSCRCELWENNYLLDHPEPAALPVSYDGQKPRQRSLKAKLNLYSTTSQQTLLGRKVI